MFLRLQVSSSNLCCLPDEVSPPPLLPVHLCVELPLQATFLTLCFGDEEQTRQKVCPQKLDEGGRKRSD